MNKEVSTQTFKTANERKYSYEEDNIFLKYL